VKDRNETGTTAAAAMRATNRTAAANAGIEMSTPAATAVPRKDAALPVIRIHALNAAAKTATRAVRQIRVNAAAAERLPGTDL
jgi:hypothetical protein